MRNTEKRGIIAKIKELFARCKRKALPAAEKIETSDSFDGAALDNIALYSEKEQYKVKYVTELGVDASIFSLPGARKYIFAHPICKDIVDNDSYKDAKNALDGKYGIIKTELDGVKKIKIFSNEGKEAICVDTAENSVVIGTIIPEQDGMIKENRIYNNGIETMRQITHYLEPENGKPVAYINNKYSRASVGIAKDEVCNEWIDLSVGDGDIATLDNVVSEEQNEYNPNENEDVRQARINKKINLSEMADKLKQIIKNDF